MVISMPATFISQSSISTSVANRLATAICSYADAQGLRICVSVLDRYGYPLAFQRMNEAPLHSIQIAEDKAFTAISFGIATHVWQERLKENGHLRQTLSQQPRMQRNLRTSFIRALQVMKPADTRRSLQLMALVLNKSCNAVDVGFKTCPPGPSR